MLLPITLWGKLTNNFYVRAATYGACQSTRSPFKGLGVGAGLAAPKTWSLGSRGALQLCCSPKGKLRHRARRKHHPKAQRYSQILSPYPLSYQLWSMGDVPCLWVTDRWDTACSAKRWQRCFSLGANATPGMGSSRSCRAGSDEAGGESHGTVAATSAPPSLQGAYPNGTMSGSDCCTAGVSPCSVRDRELGRTKLSSWGARGPQVLSFPKPELSAR